MRVATAPITAAIQDGPGVGSTWTTSLGVYYDCKSETASTTLLAANHEFADSYLWNTAETTSSISVTDFGTYWCTSSYGPNCAQTDTFHVGGYNYAGPVTASFAQTIDTLWQECQNWPVQEIPDTTSSVVVESGKQLYLGNNVTGYCKDITVDAGGSLHIEGGRLICIW